LHEEGDWEDSLPKIYEEIRKGELDWIRDDVSGLGGEEKEILQEICQAHEVPPGMMVELLDLERKMHGMSRRSKVYDGIDTILSKDWMDREEALAQRTGSEAQKEEA
jgi:DNA sulfur modification protein DndC